jgi:drug/metabolite transporter (DMT)-like permease
MSTPLSARADLQLIGVTLLAAAGWLFSHEALQGIAPLWFIGIRFSLAGLILALMAFPTMCQLNRAQWSASLKVGAWFAAGMLLWIMGLFHTKNVGEGAFITSMGVVLVPLVGWITWQEKPSAQVWGSAAIAISGLACLMLGHGIAVEPSQWFFASAAVLFAIYFSLNNRVVSHVPSVALTAIALGVVGIAGLITSLLLEDWTTVISTATWGWIIASIVLSTCMRFWLQTASQKLTSASHAALILTLEPLWTALLSAYWLGERMSPLQLAGCGLIFSALIVSRLPMWQRISTPVQ